MLLDDFLSKTSNLILLLKKTILSLFITIKTNRA
jgi:hypothetical protein